MKLLLSDTRITINVTRDGKVENCITFYTKYTFAILSTLTKKTSLQLYPCLPQLLPIYAPKRKVKFYTILMTVT